MNIAPDTVRHIAQLARLRLEPDQLNQFTVQLSRILEAVDVLRELDTSTVEPFTHPMEAGGALRPDTPASSAGSQAVLANAPHAGLGFYQVPKVIE